ncbi:MAG: helix-turn-helix transcriptional regulator [Chloroflexi bacterium]|nr:helix-turn-helix transcriptional regulator [Chloroflexota bacterium]
MGTNAGNTLGEIIKKQRISLALTLQELAAKAKVSASHLGRIERGERFPSARILRRIAGPLDFEEDELFTLAGYLTPQSPGIAEQGAAYSGGRLDPYVARVLAQEPVEVQRALLSILAVLKTLSKTVEKSPGQ